MHTLDEAKKIKKKYEADLMRKKGVVACAVGYKHVEGKKTDRVCIICYVIDKIPENQIEEADLIPPVLEGIPTEVIVSGEMRVL
jgi:hypothetical protein